MNPAPTTAKAALQKGLKDLEEACDVIAEKFTAARDKFAQDQGLEARDS